MKNLHPQLQKCHNKFNLSNSSPLFDYSETIYIKVKSPVKIKCLKCNTLFEQRIDKHLESRQGDCLCNNKLNKFVKVSASKHNCSYINTTLKINPEDGNQYWAYNIKCMKCNTLFDQREISHKKGHNGCSQCSYTNHPLHGEKTYKNINTTLYYIKVNEVYKIGLTMKDVKTRFISDKDVDINIIKTWNFDDGAVAYNLEQEILSTYSELKYTGVKILKSGNSELFRFNIINEVEELIENS